MISGRQIATLLCTAVVVAGCASGKRQPPEYPLYRHDDLQACFAPVVADLRRMLSTVLERNAVQIELVDRSHGVRIAVFPDAELAVNALRQPGAACQRRLPRS